MGKYDDIINLPHHVSENHRQMPMINRAAQFAPFAALSGHEDAIAETMRITENFKELSEEEKNKISRKLSFAIENHSFVEILYFVEDKYKSGGTYKKVSGIVKKRDPDDNTLHLSSGNSIPIQLISEIHFKKGGSY